MKLLLTTMHVAVLLTAAAQAAPKWMNDEQLREAFAGKEIEGFYRSGRMFRESYKADKRLEYREGARTETGYWRVVSGTFCTIYDGMPSGGCFRVHRLSVNCFEFYFQARDEDAAADIRRRGKPSWTARAWRTDQLSTCEDRPTV